VLILETGVGRGAAGAALNWLLGASALGRPGLVVYAGFAGALDAGLRVGDVLVAKDVIDASGRSWATGWPDQPGQARLLTVPRLVGSPREKQRLGHHHRADAVDMESAYVADRCARHGIRFGCVRAISDHAHAALSPALVGLLSGGRVSPHRALSVLLREPSMLGALWRLARDTRVAAMALAGALGRLLDPPGSPLGVLGYAHSASGGKAGP
jgi:adenosylhomocysteine nucleosidase